MFHNYYIYDKEIEISKHLIPDLLYFDKYNDYFRSLLNKYDFLHEIFGIDKEGDREIFYVKIGKEKKRVIPYLVEDYNLLEFIGANIIINQATLYSNEFIPDEIYNPVEIDYDDIVHINEDIINFLEDIINYRFVPDIEEYKGIYTYLKDIEDGKIDAENLNMKYISTISYRLRRDKAFTSYILTKYPEIIEKVVDYIKQNDIDMTQIYSFPAIIIEENNITFAIDAGILSDFEYNDLPHNYRELIKKMIVSNLITNPEKGIEQINLSQNLSEFVGLLSKHFKHIIKLLC